MGQTIVIVIPIVVVVVEVVVVIVLVVHRTHAPPSCNLYSDHVNINPCHSGTSEYKHTDKDSFGTTPPPSPSYRRRRCSFLTPCAGLKYKYPYFEVGLKCILTVNPYLCVLI